MLGVTVPFSVSVIVPAVKASAGFQCPLELHSLPHRHSRSAKSLVGNAEHSVSHSPGARETNSKRPPMAPTRKMPAPKAGAGFHCHLELHSLLRRHWVRARVRVRAIC